MTQIYMVDVCKKHALGKSAFQLPDTIKDLDLPCSVADCFERAECFIFVRSEE